MMPAPLLAALAAHGLAPDGAPFGTRRPDRLTMGIVTPGGARGVVKLYPSQQAGERAFANMSRVWNSRFGVGRQPPGLAQPLDFFPDCAALMMERLAGKPLAEFPLRNGQHFDDSLRLLAELHTCEATPETRRNSRGLLRSATRKAERIAELAPEHAALAHDVLAALTAARVKERELVPSHGDFSPRNVIVGDGRLALMDWDRLQLADPARDVAYFATYDWADALRHGREPDRAPLQRAMNIYETARPGANLKRSLSFHVAAGCLRRAVSVLELWPDQATLSPAWLHVALRELTIPRGSFKTLQTAESSPSPPSDGGEGRGEEARF